MRSASCRNLEKQQSVAFSSRNTVNCSLSRGIQTRVRRLELKMLYPIFFLFPSSSSYFHCSLVFISLLSPPYLLPPSDFPANFIWPNNTILESSHQVLILFWESKRDLSPRKVPIKRSPLLIIEGPLFLTDVTEDCYLSAYHRTIITINGIRWTNILNWS